MVSGVPLYAYDHRHTGGGGSGKRAIATQPVHVIDNAGASV